MNWIYKKDADEAKKKMEELLKARSKAKELVKDALARYVKTKTHARSKKAAMEKDALLNSPRYKKLSDYDRRSDIQEAYGCDYISGKERDLLEDLWDEREEIRKRTEDGIYQDDVTKALDEAYVYLCSLWDSEIEKNKRIVKAYEQDIREGEEAARAWMDKVNKEYEKMCTQ